MLDLIAPLRWGRGLLCLDPLRPLDCLRSWREMKLLKEHLGQEERRKKGDAANSCLRLYGGDTSDKA